MSTEVMFIIFAFIPFIILGILMVRAQSKFLQSYREIVNPDEPISSEEVLKLFVEKPGKSLKFIKQDLITHPGKVANLYWMHFNNAKLEEEAKLVRTYTTLTIVIPALGFIIAVFLALNNS